MTNTHRKTTNRTTAKIAAVGAFGLGAAIAFPGLAAAQANETPTDPTASLANAFGEDGSLEGALETALAVDAGSLTFNLNLDAETPNPGSVELGSLGVSPNTGSGLIDGDSGSAEEEAEEETGDDSGSLGSGDDGDANNGDSGSLDLGSLGSSDETATDPVDDAGDSGSLGSGDGTATEPVTGDPAADTGSLSDSLAGLSSDAADDDANGGVGAGVTANADVGLGLGSLG